MVTFDPEALLCSDQCQAKSSRYFQYISTFDSYLIKFHSLSLVAMSMFLFSDQCLAKSFQCFDYVRLVKHCDELICRRCQSSFGL